MMKIIFLIFSIILIILESNGQSLTTSDYSCVNNLVVKTIGFNNTLVSSVMDPNSGLYNFCNIKSIFTCLYTTQPNLVVAYINSITLTNNDTTFSNINQLAYQDFSCFSKQLGSLYLNNYKISGNEFFGKVLASSISLISCRNVGLPQSLPTGLTSITLDLVEPLLNQTISNKIFTTLKRFELTSSLTSTITLPTIVNDVTGISVQMDYIKLFIKTVPDFTGFNVSNLIIIIAPNGLSLSNLNTFYKIKNLEIQVQSQVDFITFPTLLSNENFIETFSLNSDLRQPTGFIDISKSVNLKSLTYTKRTSSSAPFVYPIDSKGFPFINFPASMQNLDFQSIGVLQFPNSNIFSTLKTLNLNNNQISGGLPSIFSYKSLTQIILKNNNFSGSIPSSFCNILLDVSNNPLIIGQLPSCFACYLIYQPTIKNNFVGTGINLDINTCTSSLLVVPNLKVDIYSGDFRLWGNNLGYQLPISYPSSIGTMEVPNLSFTGKFLTISSGIIVIPNFVNFNFMNVNYTLATNFNNKPIVNLIFLAQLGTLPQYQIFGSYFSYNVSDLSVTIDGKACLISVCSFTTIYCSIDSTNTVSGGTVVNPAIATIPKEYLVVYVQSFSLKTQVTIIPGLAKNPVTNCKAECQNNGICDTSTGTCDCTSTVFVGDFCNQTVSSLCPNDCSGHGTCVIATGKCSCLLGWDSIDCSIPLKDCIDPCINGVCNSKTGSCDCNFGWSNITCNTPDLNCAANCSYPNGVCDRNKGECACGEKWQSNNCSIPLIQCSKLCSSFGICNHQTGLCECVPNWIGDDCSIPHINCTNGCSNHGVCNYTIGECSCNETYSGKDCSMEIKKCPNNCGNNNGFCDTSKGVCQCFSQWTGADCSIKDLDCPNSCNGNGICERTLGQCKCNSDYTKEDCSIPNQYISSIEPSTTQGGLVSIRGWFGNKNEQLTVKIGSLPCIISEFNSSSIVCRVDAGSGTKSVNVTQNNIIYNAIDIYHYTEISYRCLNDCSGHGTCNTMVGQCKCEIGWSGFDCGAKSTKPSTSGPTTTTTTTISTTTTSTTPEPTSEPIIIPETTSTINTNIGSAVISNQKTSYEIKITSLLELDFNQVVVKNNVLQNKWIVDSTIENKYIFNQTLENTNCTVSYTIEELKESREYSFAGLDLSLEKDSIKISVEIKNYPYIDSLNTLQLQMESIIGTDNSKNDDGGECNQENTSIDTNQLDKNQLLNYITISKDQKILYGRFINRVISDTRPTFITTSVITPAIENSETLIIGLNLPHCTSSCLIDPDFSVLVKSTFKQCVDGKLVSQGRASWVLPVAIVVPCVAIVSIIIIGGLILSKNGMRIPILLAKQKYSLTLKKLSKKSKDELYMPNN